MKTHSPNPKIDAYVSKDKNWQAELNKLRSILLDCGLAEELKWGKPCYTFENHNIVIIQPFKAYCALLFFKGALLKDASNILVKTGENTQAGRQIRFTDVNDIAKMESVIKAYIHDAIRIDKAGLKVKTKKISELTIPEEFQRKLDEIPTLQKAFSNLTPGRQKAYIFYFSAAKQSKTRESRIEKYRKLIIQGKGLNDA